MSAQITTAIALSSTPMKFLDQAITTLKALGLPVPADQNEPMVALVSRLATTDEGRALAIARVLQQASYFNAVVRDEIATSEVSDRYIAIVQDFDSIRDDGRRMINQMANGKLGLKERVANAWMKVSRGDMPSRFERIRKVFLAVSKDTSSALERESRIMTMYGDFRLAVKEAEILAHEIVGMQESRLQRSKDELNRCQEQVDAMAQQPTDPAAMGRLVLARDQCVRLVQEEDARFQVAKDLAENLQIGYATSEAVMLRVHQTHEVKRRVHERAVAFMATNETVLTAINSAFASQMGLHETTKTLDAMVEGTNRSLDAVAEIGDVVLKDGLRAGYGSTLNVESVRKLIDAVVRFQEASIAEIADLRQQATLSATEISQYVEQGKKRYATLVQGRPSSGDLTTKLLTGEH